MIGEVAEHSDRGRLGTVCSSSTGAASLGDMLVPEPALAPTTKREQLHPRGCRIHFRRSAKGGEVRQSPTLGQGQGAPLAWSAAPVADL